MFIYFFVIFNSRFNKKKEQEPNEPTEEERKAVAIKNKHQLDMQYFAVVMILANINYGMYTCCT